MDRPVFIPDWRDKVIYSAGDPQPQVLHEDSRAKLLVVGFEPGGRIPVHVGGAGVYHFVEGAGQMQVGDETFDVQVGSIVIVPDNVARGLHADTRLAFVAVRIL